MVHESTPRWENCPLPDALEVIGERWSFLILRGAMSGLRHFEEFQSSLGIARNILSNRLTRMVDNGILDRQVMDCDKRRVEYRLTCKGRALGPVMIALRQWAEKWERGAPCTPRLVDRRDRQPVQEVVVLAQDGRRLETADILWIDLAGDDRPQGALRENAPIASVQQIA
ncbi:winged helix-turn-helix transcriptional regulator [Sphingobium subterraneum]|uniref:DNA-binding HxlR family transcriptional regulator n=1 Tax=Sphingobium subterraneum TaxID=627688 RepID=A0A841JAD3_9SPHN|nr:helix-turn-helix domain-containing protein [Sphingobium subterraneum]MBB6125101.1 DNA-binding HxlR family transcriptional regulator [Sphingobium subterraneum]